MTVVCKPTILYYLFHSFSDKNFEMKRKLTFCILLLSLLLPGICSAAGRNPLPVDPDLRIGTLPNGLTYYIRHNDHPSGRADFFLAQRVGSFNEEENQRGLAHFLEHMCFNGTKHFPGNSLISYLESIGVKFGANLNAYTSTDETVYNICDVPSARSSSLDSCLLILRDWSHDLTLADEDIDAERGVIKGEWRQRNGAAATRLLERAAPVVYGSTIYGHRMPIGLMDVVEHFPYKDLRDYYQKWYHPQNQCVIVVGDVDCDAIEAEIRRLWADIARPGHDATPPAVSVPSNSRPIATVQSDPEQVRPMVQIYLKHDDTPAGDLNTIDELRRDLAADLVTSMLVERMDDLENRDDALLSNIGVGEMGFLLTRSQRALMVRAMTAPAREAEAVGLLAAELQRAALHGFTDVELRRARLDFQSNLDAQFAARSKTTNTDYARRYVRHYLDGGNSALPSAEQYYRMMKGVINQVGLEQVNEYVRNVVSPDGENVVLIAYLPAADSLSLSDSSLATAYVSVDREALTPYVAPVNDKPLLAALPTSGKVVSENIDSRFGSTVWTLSNGIRVHLLPTEYKPDQVIIAGYSPGGFSQGYTPSRAADYRLANDILASTGFGGHSSTELRRLLAGKKVRVDLTIDNMEERIAATTTPADLTTALQLIYLKATAPTRDDRAVGALLENKRLSLSSQTTNPTFVMADSIHYYVYNCHPLGEKLHASDIDSVSYQRIIDLHKDRFGDMTDFDFYILGDFNIDSIRPEIERYIASLPSNGRRETPADIGYGYAKGRRHMRFTTPMETPQTIAYTFFNAPCDYNLENVIKGHIVGSLLQSKLLADIREARGWTYGVKAHGGLSAGMNGSDRPNYIMPVYIRVAPENADSTFSIVAATADSLADPANISQEELDKIRQYMLKSYSQDSESNAYWLTVMHMHDKFGRDMHNGYKEIVNSQTPETIAAFARQYLLPANRIQLEMSPR